MLQVTWKMIVVQDKEAAIQLEQKHCDYKHIVGVAAVLSTTARYYTTSIIYYIIV